MSLRRAPILLGAALLSGVILVSSAQAGGERRGIDPVTIDVKAPGVVARAHNFSVTVKVTADAGALDIAPQPLRLHVLLASECGGSFAGTTGTKVMDRPLPAPVAGSAYSYTAKGRSALPNIGTRIVCVFVSDADERQYATSTGDSTVAATKSCTKQTKKLAKTRRAFKGAHGDRRHRLAKKLHDVKRAQKRACTPKA